MSSFAVSPSALEAALREWDDRFDPGLHLVRGAVGEVRYHTRLEPGTPVHPTRESTEYAAALIEGADPVRHARAAEILKAILPLQDVDPASPSCGIWPWFYEEPLAQMSPPDWNWADFLGAQLAQILWRNEARLAPELVGPVRESLRLAARSIIKRDVRLSYTNIAIMGAYVTVMAGQILGDAEILAYGRDRLKRFVEFTRNYGGFPEYNSPTYFMVGLIELGRMLRDFTDEGDLALVREIYELIWGEIAVHWHGPSEQWAGPHSRSYSTLLKPEILAFLQAGLGDKIVLTDQSAPASLALVLTPVECPSRFLPLFADSAPRRDHRMNISEDKPPMEAQMHMEPDFVLSTAQRGTFWNQARSLIAYAPSSRGAVSFTARFLHDGYDFCSANLLTRQSGARVLAGICLADDGGDKHGELDRFPDGVVSAEDWRLRLEFLNCPPFIVPPPLSEPWILPFGDRVSLRIRWLRAIFGEEGPIVDVGASNGATWIDLVFFRGPRREFRLRDSFPACLGFALEMLPSDRAPVDDVATACEEGQFLRMQWGDGLHLSVPESPLPESSILACARAQKLGEPLDFEAFLNHPRKPTR